MQKTAPILILAALLGSAMFGRPAMAEEAATAETIPDREATEDEAELDRLLEILEKHTAIATKTKLNADFVPGMVSVLYGDELEARGVRTVGEALSLVPGMEISLEPTGNYLTVVRGVSDVFLSGSVKILLNEVPMNTALFGDRAALLQLAVAQVERIEVICGPGSAVHGEFAYTAVINIVTRKEDHRVCGRIGGHDTYGGTVVGSWAAPERELRMSLNLSGWKSGGADVESGPDRLHGMGFGAVSNAPGPINEDREIRAGILTLDYRNFSLIAQVSQVGSGDFFGIANALPRADGGILVWLNDWGLELRQHLDLTSSLGADLRLGWAKARTDVDPIMINPPGFAGIYLEGMFGGAFYEETRLRGGVDLTWKGWDRHTVLVGLSFADAKMGETYLEANYVPSTLAPLPSIERFYGSEGIVLPDQERFLNSLTLQDELRLTPRITVTAGLRYDDYDDVGGKLTPRLAGVWRLTDHHILKAQYAEAFRPPTFLELYATPANPVVTGHPDVEPATINTFELGYIYRESQLVVRATVFFSDLEERIVFENGLLTNAGRGRLRGVELELEHTLTPSLKLDAALSFVDTEDLESGEALADSVDGLANFGLLFKPRPDLTLNLQYRYVGDRHRHALDPRADLAGYHTVDTTASLFNLGTHGLTLRATLRNLLDEHVRHPAAMGTYPEDYPRPGREWEMLLTYEF
ncbi:MAG: TonB-dependent receptor [bacterium]|nr:TonB-dependent receptor [bacterium]